MAKKEITSRPGMFGIVHHYDAKGKKVGSSTTGGFGRTTHYDAKGHRVGSSQAGSFTTNHYNSRGHRIGKTTPGGFGRETTRWEKQSLQDLQAGSESDMIILSFNPEARLWATKKFSSR